MSTIQRGLKNYFLQIKRSPMLSANKMKRKIKRVKSVNALREKNWDDRFIYDKIPLYDSKNDKNVLINLNTKCHSGNRKFGNKGINFPDNSLQLYRPLSNKTTMNHLLINSKNNLMVPSAKSRDINFRNEIALGNKYKSFLEHGTNYTNGIEKYKLTENKNTIKNNIDTNNFNVINIINMNNLKKMWDDLAVNINYRKLFEVIYKELDEENKEELYKKETNELNKVKNYINSLKQNIEKRINTIQELFDLNVKLNTEIINKDNKCNEMILGEIADKINELRMHTVNVCKAMQRVKTELSGIKNLDKFDINLIGEKFNFDKNYLIKMKSELTFLREGFIKYYFNIGNDQTPFLLKASQKNKIGNDQDPFIHLVPLDQKLKEEITECTYYIYQELIAYQNEKVHNKVLRSISPLKRIIKINAQDEAKNLGERDESDNKRSMNEHIFNKMNVIMNKDIGIKNHVNMSEDNINNKFNTLQLSQFSKNNKIINNNSNFRKFDLINNNKSEENNNKIMNDLSNKNQEMKNFEPKEDIKYIKNIFTDKEKIISKSSSSTIRINQGEKRTISESMGDKTNDGGRSVFMKYKINEKEKNNESPQFKSKSISQINNVNSNNDKNIKILPENNKKEEENKLESSGYDEFVS
jgi:hypothetical protein